MQSGVCALHLYLWPVWLTHTFPHYLGWNVCIITHLHLYSCTVCLMIVCFHLLFSNYLTYGFLYFLCLFSCFVCLLSFLCILCSCIVLCTVSPLVYNCLFTICVHVYRPQPPGGNSTAVNIYQIIYHIRRDFSEKKKLSSIKCVLWFSLQLFSKNFLILRRIERDMIKNVSWSSRKVPVKMARV